MWVVEVLAYIDQLRKEKLRNKKLQKCCRRGSGVAWHDPCRTNVGWHK